MSGELPADPWTGVVGGLREASALWDELTSMALVEASGAITEMGEDDLRWLLFTRLLHQHFRDGLDEKRERIEAEAFKAALRGRDT
jgi:hypothetical protein